MRGFPGFSRLRLLLGAKECGGCGGAHVVHTCDPSQISGGEAANHVPSPGPRAELTTPGPSSILAVGQNPWDPMLVGLGEFTTHARTDFCGDGDVH